MPSAGHIGAAKCGDTWPPVNHDLFLSWRVGSFLIAAVTNDYKLGGLRQHIFKIVRRRNPDWKKVFAKDITDKGLLSSKIYK